MQPQNFNPEEAITKLIAIVERPDEVSRIQNAAIMSTDDEMAELIADIESNCELVKRLTARAAPFTVSAARPKMDADRISSVSVAMTTMLSAC